MLDTREEDELGRFTSTWAENALSASDQVSSSPDNRREEDADADVDVDAAVGGGGMW